MTKRSFHSVVVIGRWQLPHRGHDALFRAALSSADNVIIVIGSAFRSRDSRNPFSWEERKAMISLSLGSESERVTFVPVRDYYDDERWAREVTSKVTELVPHGAPIGLVGHPKDATTAYLNRFPQWTKVMVEPVAELGATAIRAVYFESDDFDIGMKVLEPYVLAPCLNYLQSWSKLADYGRMVDESRAVTAYKKRWTANFYQTADALVQVQDKIALIRRGGDIGHGLWALPGGFLNPGERYYDASLRELQEETGLHLLPSTMAHALRDREMFDHPLRSARGGIQSVAHYFELGNMEFPELVAADDAMDADWFTVPQILAMEDQIFEDHTCIIDRFKRMYAQKA